MKAKRVNWKKWEELLEFLKKREPKAVNMHPYLNIPGFSNCDFNPGKFKKAPPCGTVGCIGGWASILFSTPRKYINLETAIDLDNAQTAHVIWAGWRQDRNSRMVELGKREVIRYMTKALKEKDVMVKL